MMSSMVHAAGRLVLIAVAISAAPSWAARGRCAAVPGADAILAPGARVVVGEVQGTNETPKLIADIVCDAAKRGAVRLGLDIGTDEQRRIDRFVASGGSVADRKALL